MSRPQPRGVADERGATLALVAMALVGFVGLAALVVDVGDAWLTRRNLVPATDAAALAAAQELIERPWDTEGACAVAGTFVAGNAPASTMTTCDVVPLGPGSGRVAIEATEGLESYFAAGGDDRETISASAAAWGAPLTVSGLRPVGLCYDGSPELRQLIDNPPTGPTWVVVDFATTVPGACGGVAGMGNFLSIDFEGGVSLSKIRTWTRSGYPEQVAFEEPTASGCDGDVVCYHRPYVLPDLVWQLTHLRDNRTYASYPIYDYADADEVHLIGVIRARLYAFDLDGWAQDWSLQLKVEPGLVGGTCCGPGGGIVAGNKAIVLCGVDPADLLTCDPGTGP